MTHWPGWYPYVKPSKLVIAKKRLHAFLHSPITMLDGLVILLTSIVVGLLV